MLRVTLVMLGTLMLWGLASAAHHHHHRPHGKMSADAESVHHNAPHVHMDPDGTVHLNHVENVPSTEDKDEGETWASRHFPDLQMDTKFYCPKEFVPGRPGGFLDSSSQQACCMLDKSLAVMEMIYLMRHCTAFKPPPGHDKWSSCSADALNMVYWHLRACCVDLKFFHDHTERKCMSYVIPAMRTIRKTVGPQWNKCVGVGYGYEKDPGACSKAEEYAVKFLIPKIHKGAQALFTDRDLTDTSRKFLRESAVNSMDTIKAVFMDNGGITTDGEPCLGARRRLKQSEESDQLSYQHRDEDNIPYGEPMCAHCEPHCPHTQVGHNGRVEATEPPTPAPGASLSSDGDYGNGDGGADPDGDAETAAKKKLNGAW